MLLSAQTPSRGLAAFLQLFRPHHWTKNAFCLAGVFFSGHLTNPDDIVAALLTCLCFCAASSAVYIFNDVLDRGRDQLHPVKSRRPIARGAVSPSTASAIALILATASMAGAFVLGVLVLRNHPDLAGAGPGQWLLWQFGVPACLALYIANNVAYSLWFKHLALIDVLSIACGFVLRLLAGVYVVGVLPTTWITLCTFFLTVFLGFAKRRSELAGIVEAEDTEQRPVLSKYTLQLLDHMLISSAVMAVVCYALFTGISGKNPTLVITVPIVFFAVMHYWRLVALWNFGEEPEVILLRDLRIKLSIVLWLICYALIMYYDVHLFR
jgi:4-hydroxybenzoate polyprenyltransferase